MTPRTNSEEIEKYKKIITSKSINFTKKVIKYTMSNNYKPMYILIPNKLEIENKKINYLE